MDVCLNFISCSSKQGLRRKCEPCGNSIRVFQQSCVNLSNSEKYQCDQSNCVRALR